MSIEGEKLEMDESTLQARTVEEHLAIRAAEIVKLESELIQARSELSEVRATLVRMTEEYERVTEENNRLRAILAQMQAERSET